MTLTELITYTESHFWAAYINCASGFSTVLAEFQRNEKVKALVDEIKDSPEKQHQILERISSLLGVNEQPEYRHPDDTAVATYLYALSTVNEDLGRQAADKVLETPNLFWAKRLAEHIRAAQTQTP